MTSEAIDQAIQTLNDRYGVKSWETQEDGTVLVTLDDEDQFVIQPDGSFEQV